jgi:hypothetical protein
LGEIGVEGHGVAWAFLPVFRLWQGSRSQLLAERQCVAVGVSLPQNGHR